MARLRTDDNGNNIQVFFIDGGGVLTSPFTPTENMVISPVGDMNITIDDVSKDYDSGSVFGLSRGKTYTITGTLEYHMV